MGGPGDDVAAPVPPPGPTPDGAPEAGAADRPPWRRVALFIAIAGELLLIGGLAAAAWAPHENSSYPPLSLRHGLETILGVGGVDSIFLLSGAAVIATGRRFVAPIIGGGLLLIAAFLGFLAAAMVNLGRCTTCDDA